MDTYDNHAFYGFMAAAILGVPVSLYIENASFMPVAWVIGVTVFWCKRLISS